MSKIFQVLGGICHWDATRTHLTLDSVIGRYSPDILFVEAPNYVFEGWGFDPEGQGDARFVRPESLDDHWLYDQNTGTWYPDPNNPPEGWNPPVEQIDLLAEADARILELEYQIIMLQEGL